MLKICSRCGKLHDVSYKCYTGYRRRQDEAKAVYSTGAWKRKSESIKKESHYLCEVCLDKGIITQGEEVHHIIKVNDDSSLAFEDENLICLCISCHKKAECGHIKKEYLRQLVNRRYAPLQDKP